MMPQPLRAVRTGNWRIKLMAKSGPVKLWTLWALGALVLALIVVEAIHHRPANIATLVVVLIHLLIFSMLYWRQSPGREDRPMISLVLLLAEQRYLDERALGKLVEKAWGVAMNDPNTETNFVA